ncbi:probable transcriptional regulator SLK2 [Zingiber officinale]|uniref:probable transcriptional regulator SLK2 n=1 Tax=Zingiber officinale TaxID=94328 RepID=UPI001C4C9F9E|nr:probable transcriptional regulator SLK2 [Zingiber officinale]
MSANRCSGLGPASSDINQILNSTGNTSGPSVGASSLVTDANSALSGVSQLQRSTSFNNESYMRLPASPMSFSSNISGSSVMDGCSIMQQSSLQEQVQRQGLSTATSQLVKREPTASMNAQKRARLDGMDDDALQQQIIQQLLQRNETMQPPQGLQNQQLQAIFQEQRLMQRQRQQQQMIHSLSQMQRPPIALQQPQQLHHLMQPNLHPNNSVKQPLPFNNGICFRRLMQYLYHLRHRPADNSILYWRKFVTEYFAPRARKRWCLSLFDNIGNHTLGIFPQLAVDGWQCDVCGSKCGKGFEATFEVLPRLFQIKFDHGVVDENLFLDMPHECRLSSGIMVLKYERAVHESIFEHLRTVHEGQLRIIFTPELKILSWEFCARKHEEFVSRRLVASQVNQVLQVAQKYRTALTENSSAGISHQDLQSSCNMFAAAGRQLARNLDLQSVNDLGFSKRFVRCLQIAEVVCSMKDLIDFSQEQKVGAIECLKNYPRHAAAKLQKLKVEPEESMSSHCLTGEPSLDKVVGNHPGLSGYINKNLTASQVITNSQQNIHALNNYQSSLRNPSNLKQNVLYQEALSSPRDSKHTQPVSIQGSGSSSLTNTSMNKLPGQQPPPFESYIVQNNDSQTSQINQHIPQHMLQKMLQELRNKGTELQPFSSPNTTANHTSGNLIVGGGTSFRNGIELQNMPNNNLPNNNNLVAGQSASNSFKSTTSANNPSISSSNTNSRSDLPENLDLPELENIAQEFLSDDMFDGDSW